MECSGLKEEMRIEDAFCILVSTAALWKSILSASGNKTDDLCKEKLYIKAKNTISEVKEAVRNRTINLSFLRGLQEKRKLCFEYFTLIQENERENVEKEWFEISNEIDEMMNSMEIAIGVFQITKKKMKMNIPIIIDCVEFCLAFLQEKHQQVNKGNVTIVEATSLFSHDKLLEEMWEGCKLVKEVVKSEVYWNIANEFIHEIDINTEENQCNEYLGIALLFEESDVETDDSTDKYVHIGCNILKYMLTTFQKYKEFWIPLLGGKDVSLSTLLNILENADITQELTIAESICLCTAKTRVHRAFHMYNEFERQTEKVHLMKSVLLTFSVDITQDDCFQTALTEYEKLLEGNIAEMTLFHIETVLVSVARVVNVVNTDMLAILKELQKSSLLIDFLLNVVDEDIRNLIDAVEEHSEQYVRESTVSDLIEVKRFLQPLLKQKYDENIQKFFSAMSRSLETSGIKNVERKIHECYSNLHSLKALYNHVANRGEHTKEIIENITRRGVFHFSLKEKDCDVVVEYKQDKKTHSFSKSYLNDLRSRALLILNAEDKQQDKMQLFQNKKEHLSQFIEMVDIALNIGHVCVLLKGAGHFQYVKFEHKKKNDTLHDLLKELESKYEEWCKTLCECRSRFYLMNYIHSDQLQLMYNFTKTGENKESVITILKFINPALSNIEDILHLLHQNHEDSCPEKNLEALGKALDFIGKKIVPKAEMMFDKKPNSKLSDIVQPGRLYVTALEPDSQLVVRTVLALHWHTNQSIPFAQNILLCNKNTRTDEITLLLNRCLGCENGQLFSIANIEMLAHETQDFLAESLTKFQSNTSFHLALLFRGNSHHPLYEKFADLIMRPKPITENELQDFFSKKYPNVLTVTSAVPGLGKSEEVKRLALQNQMGKITLHISGIFDRETIVEELTKLKIKQFHVLHVDIGPVDEPFELDAFLFELIVLKHVSARKFAFYLQTDYICVEIANSVNQELNNSLPTVTCFRRKHLIWNNYSNMHVSQEVNSPVQVVCQYLNLQDSGKLDQTDLYLTGNKRVRPLSATLCRDLLEKHFSTSGDMSYTIVNIFLGVLADQLKRLSSSVFFRLSNIQHELVKSELVTALKNMSIDFSSRSINACRSAQSVSMGVVGSSQHAKPDVPVTSAEILAKRTESMIRWEDSNHLMVLFHYDLQTVSALYRDKDKVPKQISSLFESQLKKKLENFGEKSQDELKSILLKLVQHPSNIDGAALNKISKQYALTPDNLLKMVLIVLRMQGHQPIIIMGETGCGKTSLIRFLSTVCQIDFQILCIHAGVTEDMLINKISACDSDAKKNFARDVWLFLDEINTCDHLGLICDVLCHHHCKGKSLAPNLKLLAACNPYRLRSDKSILTSGLQGKIKTDQLSKLVYRVNPLPETMIDYVWDYGSLQKKDEKAYIERMVQKVFPKEKMVHLFVELLTMSQQFVKKEEGSDCCVSLRDVERCRKLVEWFVKTLKTKSKDKLYKPYKLEANAIILALSICYHSRFPDNDVRKRYREKIATCCEKIAELQLNAEENIEKIIIEEQNDILNRMELPPGTAKNTALRENVFVILVCILNRIPVFVVGKPGCSKSLSMQLIRGNLRGKDSEDSFFKCLPQLYCVSFQGSESSTSDGIIKVFEKAQNYQNHNQSGDVLSVVILDEIGLAEISRFNPLKVLHNLLEPENQATPEVSVVGISNWALDSAKMNRAIHLSRPEMDEKELYETALSITESLMGQCATSKTTKFFVKKTDKAAKMTDEIKQLLQKLAKAYWVYNKSQKYKNFHGLRDFYSLTKYIGKGILVDKQIEQIDDVIIRGLLRNLGGLSKELKKAMLLDFQKCLNTTDHKDIGVLDLIQSNLMDRQSRHLMLVTNGDAVLSVLEDTVKEMERRHVVIFGSQFEEDLTDDYNYRILSRIILCMEQGFILILKDLETIYGSLYDMLNQNYTVVGSKKNCRIALGPYSNPMCHVHEDFKCIVLVEESKLDYSDPPFLNRFEKQQFRFEDMMDTKAINIRDDLVKFTSDLCKIDDCSYKPENAFALSGENLISSLVIKVQKELNEKEEIIKKCQSHLLWIIAPEAMIRVRDTVLWKKQPNRVKKLEQEYLNLPIHKGLLTLLEFFNSSNCHENEDMTDLHNDTSLVVIFTHEHQSLHIQSSSFKMERLRNFKSEKQLNQKVQDFFDSDSNQFLLHCDAAEDVGHILLAKTIIENCKRNAKKMIKPKSVCIICHLDRQEYKREPVTQITFLSGWKLAMLDKLYEPKTPLPKMMSLTVKEVLESRRPMIETVRNHIFWAFTTIQYVGTGQSAEKMMKIVCNLKESDFCLYVLEELVFSSIFRAQKTILENWQLNVARNENALVQASCYMNALEQYLLDQIKNPLCKIVFRLEEANAFDCVFLNDDGKDKRLTLWKNLIMKDNLVDFTDIPDPFGPECYTCSSEKLCMKLPFSYIVLCKVEKIKDDFLNTIRQLKISCDLAEDDEIPTSMLIELVGKYNDMIEQNLTEYIEEDYMEKFSEYQHDFYLMVSSHENGALDEEEKIKIMKWTQTLFDTEQFHHDFAMKVTNIHVLHWVYSSVFKSIIKVMNVVKEYTDVPMESFFSEMNEQHATKSEPNDTDTKRDKLVDRLCKVFLPTTKFMIQIKSVQKWQFLVSSVLPFFAEISLNPSSIHMLRFCNDVAQVLIPLDQEDAVHILSTFGDSLWNGTDLECIEMFEFVMTQVKVLKEIHNVDVENLQRFLCQYLLRSIAIIQEQNATFKCYMASIWKDSVLDRNLHFFGPILEIVCDLENENDVLVDIIDMNEEELEAEGYLHCINQCIRIHNDDPDSIISSLLVTSLQNIYKESVNEEILETIEGSSHEIFNRSFRASCVLRKQRECSLNLVASIAYMRNLINAYVVLLNKNNMNAAAFPIITETMNALIETGDEENGFEAQRIQCLLVYFLKSLSSTEDSSELRKKIISLENSLPVLKSLDWKDDFQIRSVTFDPLFMYRTDDDKNLEIVFSSVEKAENKRLQEITDQATTNSQQMLVLAGLLANNFYLNSQQKETNDTKKAMSECIFGMMQNKLPKIQLRVVEVLLKNADFVHQLFNINTETKSPDFQIVSILIHLLCLIVFKGETGNCWYDILTDVKQMDMKFLPGNSIKEIELTRKGCIHFCNHCKIRFVRTESICPLCHNKCNILVNCKNKTEVQRMTGYKKPAEELLTSSDFLSPVTGHLLQFLIHGCILLAYALEFVDSDRLKSLLDIEDEPGDILTNILKMKWNYLKSLAQMNNEDLCALIHVVIHDTKDVFTLCNAPFDCRTDKDCEQVEAKLQATFQNMFSEKYNCIRNARLSLNKRYEIDPNSLECQIQEVCVIEGNQDRRLMLPRLFRTTCPASKHGLIAQLFINDESRFPLLSLILTNENILALPKFILPILRWHHSTVSIGSYKMKKVDCKSESIERFLRMETDDTRRRLLQKRFEEFKTSWNELLKNESHLLESLLEDEDMLSSNSKVIKCIITDESSIIQKVLMELVQIHNFFIDSCLQFASTSNVPSLHFLMTSERLSSVKSTSLWELTSKDIIEFSSLNEEIFRYSQCKSDLGEGQDRCYDLQKIENELAHNLILDKPFIFIPSTFPRILFVDELFQNTIQLLENIKNTIPQEKLPNAVLKSILKKKDNDSSQIVELMTVLGMSMSLLKKTNGDPTLPLTEYLEGWKNIAVFPKGYKRLLPEPEDSVKLCHVVNLYVKLEELNGECILDTLDQKYRDDLPPEGRGKLETIGGSYVHHLEVLEEAMKVFIHRCLAVQDNIVSINQELIDYLNDEDFWPQGNLKNGHVSAGGQRKKLTEILCCTICVKHIYNTINFIQDFIQVTTLYLFINVFFSY